MQQVIDNTAFAGGPFVAQFEKAFADFCQCQYAIGVGSGTEALWMALLALGVGPGDEVITVPNTFIATAEAISFAGATPVFVDVDERTCTMDPNRLEDYLKKRSGESVKRKKEKGETRNLDPHNLAPRSSSIAPGSPMAYEQRAMSSGSRVKAVIPVHLYGQPADMDPILEIARKYELVRR